MDAEFIQWLHNTREQLLKSLGISTFRKGDFYIEPEREKATAFEDMLKSVGVNFIFQLQGNGTFRYHIYW